MIRIAHPDDAPAFLEIKDQLPITKTDGTTTTGGFLLGTSLENYRQYIEQGMCLVAESNNKIIGFGIIFTDQMLRDSEVWQKRSEASWNIDLSRYENRRLCYFEQLAFLKGHRKQVLALSYNLVRWAFDFGYETLFTTTVKEPILNLAAIPFIHAVAGIKAGNINEQYPKIGHINSDIYVMEAQDFYEHTETHSLAPFLTKTRLFLS